MRRRVILAPLLGGLVLILAGSAEGTPITWAFSGTVSQVSGGSGRLDGSVVVGTPFSGTYTFESTMTDDAPGDPTTGIYTHPLAPSSLQVVNVGDYSFVGPGNLVMVTNSIKDTLDLASRYFESEGLGIETMAVRLFDADGSSLQSDALPLTPPQLPSMAQRLWFIQGDLTNYFSIGGGLDSLRLVPEPASVLLILLGAGLAHRRRPGF